MPAWNAAKHPKYPAHTPGGKGGEFAPKLWSADLPSGYTVRDRRRISAATKKRWNREWGFMLRDLWTKGGHGWQPWGSGHTTSGIQNAVVDRGLADSAQSSKGPLLFRLTPDGLGRLEDWWEDFNRGADFPDAPEGAPVDYVKILSPGEQARLDEHRANLAAQAAQRQAAADAQAAEANAERAQLEDELAAIEQAAIHRKKLLASDDAPFVDMKLADWQAKRAQEIRNQLGIKAPETLTPEERKAWAKQPDGSWRDPDGWSFKKVHSKGAGQRRPFERVNSKAHDFYEITRPDGTRFSGTASTIEGAMITIARRKWFDRNPS